MIKRLFLKSEYMRAYLFLLTVLFTSTIYGQNSQFEGVIEYEVIYNGKPTAIEKHYFKDNMIRVERYSDLAPFTYIHYFHGNTKDSIYKAVGPHVQYNLDSNIYKLHTRPEWTDSAIISVAELPNQKKNIVGYDCQAVEVSYKRPQGIQKLVVVASKGQSHKITVKRWLSNDIKYHIPEGNKFNGYMVAYYDPRVALKSTTFIENDDSSIETITKTATKIQPGELSYSLFMPNRITNKLSSDYKPQE